MAKKVTSQKDLERGLIGSEPAAERVADVMRLLAMILLRDDPRVQRGYELWWARMVAAEPDPPGRPTDEAIARELVKDFLQLRALVADLGLQQYRWLAQMLRWEFQRAAEERAAGRPVPLEITVPAGLEWASTGKRPKQRVGAMGGYRLEDLERNVQWFYLCEVKHPKVSKRRLATDEGCGRANVQAAIHRVRTLLDCVNRQLPDSAPTKKNTPGVI